MYCTGYPSTCIVPGPSRGMLLTSHVHLRNFDYDGFNPSLLLLSHPHHPCQKVINPNQEVKQSMVNF